MQENKFKYSHSLQNVVSELEHSQIVSATDIVTTLLKSHSDYAQGASKPDLPVKKNSVKRSIYDWLIDLEGLYNAKIVDRLHGRLVIIGLSMLDTDLYQQLRKNEFLAKLTGELKEPLSLLLTEQANNQWVKLNSNNDNLTDRVKNHPDNPINKIAGDKLGRAAYGRYLVKRILAVKSEEAYALHIYGAWGSGKSTLLNFIKDELQSKNWLVVEFNAWRNQHMQPPWWALLDNIFNSCKKSCHKQTGFLTGTDMVKESLWRLTIGGAHAYLFVFIFAVIAAITLLNVETDKDDTFLHILENLGEAFTVVLAVWTAFQTISRTLIMRSEQTALSYMRTTNDPMGKITSRFTTLINRIRTNADGVIIMIDDLDRCRCSYVVNLLEGIQTLFREAPVVFMVAADQSWLNGCFEEVYGKSQINLQQPGKPLGTLFLEKVFQSTAPVPGMQNEVKEKYWRYLLQLEEGTSNDDATQQYVKEIINTKTKEKDMLDEIEKNTDKPFDVQQAYRAAVIERLADPDIHEQIENHTLATFANLLEPNPRSMKRFVNAYSINRALSTLGHLDINQEKLARWTILTIRWPTLADYLEENPEDVNKIDSEVVIDEGELSDLFVSDDVIKVVKRESGEYCLDVSTVELCSRLRMQ